MRRRLAVVLAALGMTAAAMLVAAPAAEAGSTTSCTVIDVPLQADPSVCLRMDFTRPAAGKIRLTFVTVTCPGNNIVFSHPAIDPIEFWVHGSNGLTVWDHSNGNSFECGEAWFPNAITCSCANLQAHLFAKARLAGTTDRQFVVNTYS